MDPKLEEILNENSDWIAQRTTEFERENGEVTEMFAAILEEMNTAGLFEAVSPEEFVSVVQGAVNGKLQSEVTAPATEFECLMIGHYSPKTRKSNVICDGIAWLTLPGGNPEPGIVSMWNDDADARKQYNKLATVLTGFTFFPNDKLNGRYNVTLQRKTNLSDEVSLPWVEDSYKAKLELVRSNYPLITIAECASKPSRLIQDGTYSYPDVLDLKRMRLTVMDYKSGVKGDGQSWGRYALIDNTFKGNDKKRSFTGWVDPVIAEKAGAGPGSYIEILGTVTRNMGDGSPEANICFVEPIILKEMVKATSGIQKDTNTAVSMDHLQTSPIRIMQDGGM